MKIAILGYDVEGRASFDYFATKGHELTICDQNPDLEVPKGVPAILGSDYLDDLDQFDLLVRTAGLPPKLILDKNPTVIDKITTQINELMKVSPTRNIIGVTGTKGKGTTSTLIACMLEKAGKRVHLGGNIGIAPLELLKNNIKSDDWLVLELSSFQLTDLQYSPRIAVCLMIAPEHLNWHSNMDEYLEAKAQLFTHQSKDDIAIFFADNDLSKQIAGVSPGHQIPYYAQPGATVDNDSVTIEGQEVCKTNELKLLGKHNWQNVCAAVTTAWQITPDISVLRSVLTNFSGLPHRLELVRKLNGVRYYDDSFGTTPDTAIVALKSFDEPKIVILGGRTKGASYDELAQEISLSNVKNVVVIGETASEIATVLRQNGYQNIVEGGRKIDEIVRQAQQLASPGDVVLLSPACASFDMFKNYKERGEQFSAAVQALV